MMKENFKDKLLSFKLKKELSADKTRRTSRLLFYVGTAYMIFGLLQANTFISILFTVCTSLVLITLGLLSRKNAVIPLIIGFVILTGAFCVDFIDFGRIGFTGLIIRVVLLGFLGSGIFHSLVNDKILSEYDQLK